MDDIIQLRCHNAALETELRLVKEQLGQAHGATNYLVTTFSKQPTNQQDVAATRLQERLNSVLAENAHLRAIIGSGRTSLPLQQAITSGSHMRALPAHALVGDAHSSLSLTPPEDNLLSFDDGDSSPPTEAWTSPSPNTVTAAHAGGPRSHNHVHSPSAFTGKTEHAHAHAVHASKAKPVGLGISTHRPRLEGTLITLTDDDKSKVSDAPPTQAPEQQDDSPRTTEMFTPPQCSFCADASPHASGACQPKPLTPNPSPRHHSPSPDAPRAPRAMRWRMVPDGDWRRLVNLSMYIEDWDNEDWEEWARKHRFLSVEGWKEYYAEVILPRYEEVKAKKAKKEGVVVVAEKVEVVEQEESVCEGELDQKQEAGVAGGEEEAIQTDGECIATVEEAEGFDSDIADTQDGTVDVNAEALESLPDTVVNVQEVDEVDEVATEADKEEEAPAELDTESPKPGEGLAASKWVTKTELPPLEDPKDKTVDAVVSGGGAANDEQDDSPEKRALLVHGTLSSPEPPTYRDLNEQQTPRPNNGGWGGRRAPPHMKRRDDYRLHEPRREWPPGKVLQGAHPRLDHETQHKVFSQAESTDLRTVLVTNIPSNIALADVLEKVRGGKVLSAVLMPTAEMRTKPGMEMNAVMVTFLDVDAAKDYLQACEKTWLYFWSTHWDAPLKATISLVPTPGRQVSNRLKAEQLSRIVYLADGGVCELVDVVASILDRAHKDGERLRRAPVRPLRAGRDKDGIMTLEYATVGDAGAAKMALDNMEDKYGAMSKGFLMDPCAKPVAELKAVAEANTPDNNCNITGVTWVTLPPPSELEYPILYSPPDPADGYYSSTPHQNISSPSAEPNYVARPSGRSSAMGGDLETARLFMKSASRTDERGGGRARPRAMRRDEGGDGYEADSAREREVMLVEG